MYRETNEFYNHTQYQVLDVSANHISRPMVQVELDDIESFINQNFQKVRGDLFQLVKVTQNRQKTYRSVSGDDRIVTESYKVKSENMEVVKTLKWTSKKFVEVK